MAKGKGGGSAPKAPDPAKVAAAQAGLNKDTALTQQQINMMNEYGPGGSSVYEQTGVDPKTGVPTYKRTVSLSPDQQLAYDKQAGIRSRLLDTANTGVDRINAALEGGGDASRKRVEEALYGRYRSYLDPLQEKQQRQLETQLANEGFSRGNEGYTGAMDEYARTRDAANLDAIRESVLQGGAEDTRSRMLPLQEQQALLGLAGGVDVPQFSGLPQTSVAGTDITGPINTQYQSQLDAWKAKQDANSGLMGSLFGLGGTILGGPIGGAIGGALGGALGGSNIVQSTTPGGNIYSDPDMKEAKAPVSMASLLKKVEGLPVESWQYKGDGQRRVGPYADDWAASFGGDGQVIDTQQAFGVSMAAIKALADKVARLEGRR